MYPCKKGDSIHIHKFNGLYKVINVSLEGFTITCKKWEILKRAPEFYSWKQFKCKEGEGLAQHLRDSLKSFQSTNEIVEIKSSLSEKDIDEILDVWEKKGINSAMKLIGLDDTPAPLKSEYEIKFRKAVKQLKSVTDSNKYLTDANKTLVEDLRRITSQVKVLYQTNIWEKLPHESFILSSYHKFIITEDYITKKLYFRYDPLCVLPIGHSSLEDFFRHCDYEQEIHHNCLNGGWIKTTKDKVILYKSSGDFGVYKEEITLPLVKEIFPNKKILSFPSKEWKEVELLINKE